MTLSTNKVLVLDIRKPVPEFEGVEADSGGRLFFEGERIASWIDKGTGYEHTKLSRTPYAGSKNHLVHRLVARAWIDNKEELTDVNHKDGNKANNKVSNLEWCSRSGNLYHAMRSGLHANPEKAVVGWNPETGHGWWFISQSEAARHGFTQANVSQVVRGKRAKCKGHYWEYA